jgi:predicted acyl esterase
MGFLPSSQMYSNLYFDMVSSCVGNCRTAPADYVRAHYTKYEYRIPMRDGKRLFTAVYVPKDRHFPRSGPYPFLMDRTPYSVGPYGEDRIRAPRPLGRV